MSGKTWGGRFSADTDKRVEAYTESISYDRRLYIHDIHASKAHATMLSEVKLISVDEAKSIHQALDEIQVQFPQNVQPKIKINDEVGMVMRYPSSDITENLTEFQNEVDLIMFFIRNCIESIYDKDNIYLVDEAPEEEVSEFINSLDIATFDKVREFFETMPKLYHKLEYTNKNGTEQVIELKSIKDFFILR
jgi:hypothetical protein